MEQLTPELRTSLEKNNFIERYRSLSSKYRFDSKDRLEKYGKSEALAIFNELGYDASFNTKESFFKIVDKFPPYRFQFHISLKYGAVELIWVVWKDDLIQRSIGPWGLIKSYLDGNFDDDKIFLPRFRIYDDLRGILKEALNMYEDFKREMLAK
ncbi:hypothetical protein [Paenibacillus sp. FSL H7-0331]|uniref:hypothetical protein n=1 Tax=Paenibacillus sp. FSL H7-0331 TaxID=1920421 RepID=UPI0009FAA171|nr:hypothetical protein [Paenibacillus sp. FSL H7-0331]